MATLGRGGDRKSIKGSFDPLIDDVAKSMKVSSPSVKRAKAVKAAAPELHEEVKAGHAGIS